MLFLKALLLGLLLPAIVGGGLSVFVSKSGRDPSEVGNGLFSGRFVGVALSIGYIVGYIGLEGIPPFPPREGVHWLCYLALIGLILGAFWHLALWRRLSAQVVVSIVVPRLLLVSMFKYSWGQVEGILWWGCLAVALFIFWFIVQQSFTALPSRGSSPFIYFGLSGGTALVLALSGSLRLAQHAGVLIAIFAASWIITLVRQRSDNRWHALPPGASPVVALVLAGIWMNGYFYEEVPGASALLLASSLFLVPVGQIAAIQRLGPRRSMLVQIAAIALPVVNRHRYCCCAFRALW